MSDTNVVTIGIDLGMNTFHVVGREIIYDTDDIALYRFRLTTRAHHHFLLN
jgi:hypothetical protein